MTRSKIVALGAAGLAIAIGAWWLTPTQRIRRLYRTIMYREPEKSGLSYWLTVYNGGVPIATIEARFKGADGAAERALLTPTVVAARQAKLGPIIPFAPIPFSPA